MESEVLWVKHDISNSLNQLQFFSISFYVPLTVSNNWRNTTLRWKKVCVIKLQLYKRPWESAYYLSETCRRYLTKAIYQLSWNEYNKAWLITSWPKHRIYLPNTSRNCFESFEYSEKRIASIRQNLLCTYQCKSRGGGSAGKGWGFDKF